MCSIGTGPIKRRQGFVGNPITSTPKKARVDEAWCRVEIDDADVSYVPNESDLPDIELNE